MAVLAENHCTHQLITAQGSIAALLQIMHTAGQLHATSRTLDLVSGSTTQQARHSNSSLSTAPFSGRAAGPLAASADPSAASLIHSVSDVMNVRMLEGEGAAAGSKVPESASSEEVYRHEQSSNQSDDSPPASSAASADSITHSTHQTGPEDRIQRRITGVCSDSNSYCEPKQAMTGACGGGQEVSSSDTDTSRGSVTEGRKCDNADGGVSSSSIHSRLLRAAHAAKAGSSGKAQAAAVTSPASPAAAAAAAAAGAVVRFYMGTLWWCLMHSRGKSLLVHCESTSHGPHVRPYACSPPSDTRSHACTVSMTVQNTQQDHCLMQRILIHSVCP